MRWLSADHVSGIYIKCSPPIQSSHKDWLRVCHAQGMVGAAEGLEDAGLHPPRTYTLGRQTRGVWEEVGRREMAGGEPERGWVRGQTLQSLVGHCGGWSWLFLGRIKTDSYKTAWNKKQLHLKNGFAMIYKRRVSIIQAYEDIPLFSN